MFDIGFFELMVVVVIGLLVIGPERLPETIRTVSLWVGRLRRSLRDTRAELEEHIGADEIRRQLHNEEVMRSLEATRNEIDRSLNERISLDGESGEHDPGNIPGKAPDPAPEHISVTDGEVEASQAPETQAPETQVPEIKPPVEKT